MPKSARNPDDLFNGFGEIIPANLVVRIAGIEARILELATRVLRTRLRVKGN